MPLYEYECTTCAHRFDQIQKLGARAPRCPKCSAPTRKQISSPAIQFKGTGWYLTDYARKGKAGGSEGGGGEAGGAAEGKAESTAPSTESAAAGAGATATDKSSTDKSSTGKNSAGKGSKGASSD